MGINRIKLANGTENMKNLQDARMQQTYQQNIADNQAQKIRNQGVLQAARNKLQNFGNTLTSGVEGAIDYSMPIVNLGKGLLTGAGEPIITDTMRQDLIQRAEAKGGNSGALGYEDYGLEANTGGRFAGGITDIINDPQAFANAATVGRVTYDRDPETGEYSFGDTNYDFNVEDTDTGLGANLLKGINEGGLTGAISNLLTPSTAAAAEPSAMPQGSPGQLNPVPSGEQNYFPVLDIENPGRYLTEEEYTNRSLKEIAERDKPTMADVAGPSQAGVVPGFTKLKNPDGAPGNYNEFMYKGPDGQIYGAQTYGSISAGQYPDIYDPNKEMMASGGMDFSMPSYNDPLPQDQLLSGFEQFKKDNPEVMRGAGTAAMVPVTLPGGYSYDFSGSLEANAFGKYLESIGQAPAQGRRQPGDLAKIGFPNEGLRKIISDGRGLAKLAVGGRVGQNMGGLMRLNYMIGGEAKQMEAGAPPIMYSGNMDPNAQAGLPSVPGPMQMAEDGPEFDMRENGGFQPLGRQEGKDDVPAMLAKNEFVMTADAVRAAGGGSIQKGAQKMYDTMKKLESRVS